MTSSEKRSCLACSKDCTLRCSNCKVVYFCNRDCQKSVWKNHKAFCKSVCNPTVSPSAPNDESQQQTCVIIDGFGPCGSGWDDMLKEREELLRCGVNVININGSKGGPSISVQVASLLRSAESKPNAMIFFGFGSGGDGSDAHFYDGSNFKDALISWCDAGGRFIVQGERTNATGSWPSWFGKKRKDSSYFRTDHKCFATGGPDTTHWCQWYKNSPGTVLSKYNVKACMLTNVDPEDRLFSTVEGASSYSLVPGFGGQDIGECNTAVAFSEYGSGTVSFFGDVNHEQDTLKIMAIIARGA